MSVKHIVFTTEEKYEEGTKDSETLYLTPFPEMPEPPEYTGGNGININANNEISVDSSVVPSKQEVSAKYTKPQSGIPASDLAEAYYLASNPSGFITKSIADLLNYYTKSQTYTKTEVDTLIGAIPTISYQIVESLPTPSAGVSFNVTKVIYMVKDGTVFNEYICIVEGSVYKWEQLGNTTIDMSDYYKKTETYSKSEIDGITDNIEDAINDLDSTKADVDDLPTKTSDLTNDSGFLTQHQDISGKLDKQTPSSSSVYAALDNGNQVMRQYTSSDTINTLMWRDTSGRSKVKNPSDALDIANKQYVDSHHDSTKQNVISDIDDIRSQASEAMPKSGGAFTGEVDFSNKNSWLKAYNMAFKNASTTLSATYPNTSISQQGDNLNIDARDGNNNLVYTVIAINTATKVADFKARPTFNGSSIALVSEIPTSAAQLNAVSKTIDETINGVKTFTTRPTLNGSGLALQSEIPTVPTKTSDLTNDSGFITPAYHDGTKQDKIFIDADLATITPVENTYYRHKGEGGGGAVATPFVLGQTYEKVYFDTSKSVEEMETILSSLEYEEGAYLYPIVGVTLTDEDTVGVMIYDLSALGVAESGYAFFNPTMDTCFFSTDEIQAPSGMISIGWQNLDSDGSYTFEEFSAEYVNNVSFLSASPFESQFIDDVIYLYSDGGFQAVGLPIRWGEIQGTVSDQRDLVQYLNGNYTKTVVIESGQVDIHGIPQLTAQQITTACDEFRAGANVLIKSQSAYIAVLGATKISTLLSEIDVILYHGDIRYYLNYLNTNGTVSITQNILDTNAIVTALNGKVSDVKINGTSVVSDGVANIPKTTASDVDSGNATSGQVLTANGSGGASWQTAGGGATWGGISGTLSNQTDLQNALNAKADVSDIPTKTSDLTNDSGFLTQHQDISGKMDKSGGTFTGAVNSSYGEIKSFKCSHQGYTNNANWYFPVAKLPKDDAGNYASAIVNGRIGGWTADNMSQFSALAWQRGNYSGTQGAVKGWIIPANTKDSALNIADLVLYYQSDLSAILYVKCYGYYTFDFDVSLYQSSCVKLFDGTYVTTPSGTLSPNGTFKNNAENLKSVAHTSEIPTKTSDLTNDSNFVSDANYVHTDNNYTNADKSKISGLPTFTYDASTYTLTIIP